MRLLVVPLTSPASPRSRGEPPARVQRQVFDAEAREAVAHRLDVRARVEQRAEQHVARDAADAVDVERRGSRPPPARSVRRSFPRRTRRRCSPPPRRRRMTSASTAARSRRRTPRRSPCSSARRSPAPRPARRRPTRAPRPSRRPPRRSPRAAGPPAPGRTGAARPRPRPGARRPRCRAARPARAPRRPPARRPSRRTPRHEPAGLGHRARDPRQPRPRVLLGVRRGPPQRRPRVLVGARDHHAPGALVQQRPRDRLDLLRRLALGHDPLGRALARLAVRVHPREAEIRESAQQFFEACHLAEVIPRPPPRGTAGAGPPARRWHRSPAGGSPLGAGRRG